MDQIIASIELSDTALRGAVARQRPGSTRMLASVVAPSAGVMDQDVVDADDLADVLSAISRRFRRDVDFPLENVAFVVPSGQLRFHEVDVAIRPSGTRGVVSAGDGERLLNKASKTFAMNGRRLLHVIPQSYYLGGKAYERLPIGKVGKDLTALCLLISCDEATFMRTREAAQIAGSENIALVARPVAESCAAVTDTEREQGTAILSLGDRISTVTVMHYGQYLGSANFGIGTRHFLNDVSIALSVPYPTAEAVLQQVGFLSNVAGIFRGGVQVGDREVTVDWVETVSTLRERAEELFTMADKAITSIAGHRELPGGLALSGRAILREGLPQVARTVLPMPVRWAAPRGIEGMPLALSDSTAWVPAVGGLVWAGSVRDPLAEPWVSTEGAQGVRAGALGRLARKLGGGRNGDHAEKHDISRRSGQGQYRTDFGDSAGREQTEEREEYRHVTA